MKIKTKLVTHLYSSGLFRIVPAGWTARQMPRRDEGGETLAIRNPRIYAAERERERERGGRREGEGEKLQARENKTSERTTTKTGPRCVKPCTQRVACDSNTGRSFRLRVLLCLFLPLPPSPSSSASEFSRESCKFAKRRAKKRASAITRRRRYTPFACISR